MDRIAAASPRLRARLAGIFYLLTGGTAFAAFVRERVMVHGDAAATAHNILASEPFYRLGFAADLAGVASYAVVTVLLYGLLAPVSRTLSLLAASFSLVGIATQALSSLGHFAPLVLLGDSRSLAAFDAGQLQAMALLSLQLQQLGFDIALVFFGLYCAVLGYLIFGSTFLPRIVGVLMTLAGVGLLTNSFATFLSPSLARALSPVTLGLDGLGELSLVVWLLAVGVNVTKWETKAHQSTSRRTAAVA